MHIKSIGIFANPNSGRALEAVNAVRTLALRRGIDFYRADRPLYGTADFGGMEAPGERLPDIMVAAGGDGTILRAAGWASLNNIPILGINFGRVGFLSEINADKLLDAIDAIEAGQYHIDSCMMLECRVNGGQALHCLNEAILYRRDFSGVITISISINGVEAGEMSGDGLIVSTPTGATGYSISAGGPVIASGLDVDIITPICPHTLSFRTIIAPPDSHIRLSANQAGFLAMDGISTKSISPGDDVAITRSGSSARFIRFGERNIFSLVRSKLS